MSKQTTHTILMVKPVAFSYNEQTAVNNYFQNKRIQRSDFQEYALHEFNELVKLLSANGIRVIVVDDTFVPHKPDSIFPNNWISFHEGGQVVLYPMFAENRRKERRNDIINIIEENGIVINNVDNFSFWEEQNLFLEGTGSMVLDRVNKIAYAALSDRTAESLFLMFCEAFDYKPICFIATHLVNDKRLPVYHTNVMMCIASTYAVICDQSIDDQSERELVLYSLSQTGKQIISITEQQMNSFAGNMLQVENVSGKEFLVMSQTAFDSLNNDQIARFKSYNDIITASIPTIERAGGGSVRCMMAEIFSN